MNCEKCQELLSDFLDGTLSGENYTLLSNHLDDCISCIDVREDVQTILDVAHEARGQYFAPPNERALWLRIRNTLEAELSGNRMGAARALNDSRESFWSRWSAKRWELSLSQVATAVAAIMVMVALATTLGLQHFGGAPPAETVAGGGRKATTRPDTAIQQPVAPQIDIDYWKQRVEQRKANWNPRMRDAFDRSMGVIDETLHESLTELSRNPHDEVSEEMLNAALRDKMELLREFSEY